MDVYQHDDSLSLAYRNDSSKITIADAVDRGLNHLFSDTYKVLILYDSTDAENTEIWQVFLEKSEFEQHGYNMRATFNELGIDSSSSGWRGYLDLIHLTGILKNEGRGAFIDTLRNRNK